MGDGFARDSLHHQPVCSLLENSWSERERPGYRALSGAVVVGIMPLRMELGPECAFFSVADFDDNFMSVACPVFTPGAGPERPR